MIDKTDKDIARRFWRNANMIRAKKGLLWKDLAERMGILPTALSNRRAKLAMPTVGFALRLADALGTSMDVLCDPEKDPRDRESEDSSLSEAIRKVHDEKVLAMIRAMLDAYRNGSLPASEG